MERGAILGIAALAACGPLAPRKPAPPPRIAIVVAERAATSVHLVALDERGDRQGDLIEPSTSAARDTHPAVSPDGAWVVFASSRGRAVTDTSLWIAPLAEDAVPVQLTRGPWIDAHPAWAPDGRSIVFASTRDGGDFDLYRLAIDHGRATGEPQQVVGGDGNEVTPCVARDGSIIYGAVARDGREAHLEQRAPDGTITRLTDGPADTSPAISPDGARIAFARPVVHGTTADGELWTIARDGTDPRLVVELPLTDESGPVWSADGRFLFATSLLRGALGNPLFSSVIVIDLAERTRRARLLQDHAGPRARLTPALARTRLDPAALDRDPEYLPELARIMADAIAAQSREPPP